MASATDISRLGPPLNIVPRSIEATELQAFREDYQAFRAGQALGARGEINRLRGGSSEDCANPGAPSAATAAAAAGAAAGAAGSDEGPASPTTVAASVAATGGGDEDGEAYYSEPEVETRHLLESPPAKEPNISPKDLSTPRPRPRPSKKAAHPSELDRPPPLLTPAAAAAASAGAAGAGAETGGAVVTSAASLLSFSVSPPTSPASARLRQKAPKPIITSEADVSIDQPLSPGCPLIRTLTETSETALRSSLATMPLVSRGSGSSGGRGNGSHGGPGYGHGSGHASGCGTVPEAKPAVGPATSDTRRNGHHDNRVASSPSATHADSHGPSHNYHQQKSRHSSTANSMALNTPTSSVSLLRGRTGSLSCGTPIGPGVALVSPAADEAPLDIGTSCTSPLSRTSSGDPQGVLLQPLQRHHHLPTEKCSEARVARDPAWSAGTAQSRTSSREHEHLLGPLTRCTSPASSSADGMPPHRFSLGGGGSAAGSSSLPPAHPPPLPPRNSPAARAGPDFPTGSRDKPDSHCRASCESPVKAVSAEHKCAAEAELQAELAAAPWRSDATTSAGSNGNGNGKPELAASSLAARQSLPSPAARLSQTNKGGGESGSAKSPNLSPTVTPKSSPKLPPASARSILPSGPSPPPPPSLPGPAPLPATTLDPGRGSGSPTILTPPPRAASPVAAKVQPPPKISQELHFSSWLWGELQSHPDESQLSRVPSSHLHEVIQVPKKLEKLLGFGLLLCLDILLHELSFTPMQVLWSLCRLPFRIRSKEWPRLTITEKGAWMRVTLLMANVWLVMFFFDDSQVYHYIRRESFLKLYVIFNMLEMFERWCRSVGVDLFDLMAASAGEPWTSLAARWACTLACCFLHSVMHLLRVLLLNVAINTSSSAVFLIIVTNNFGEIKSTVFKKYAAESLFPIVTSDIVERFYLVADLIFVVARLRMVPRAGAVAWGEVLYWLLLLVFIEVGTDWVKFCLVFKFSSLQASMLEVYREVLIAHTLLCRSGMVEEVARLFSKGASTTISGKGPPASNLNAGSGKGSGDPKAPRALLPFRGIHSFSHSLARRIGFCGLPFSTLVVVQAVALWRSPCVQHRLEASSCTFVGALLVLSLLAIFLSKVLLSAVLLGHGAKRRCRIQQGLDMFPKIKSL